MKTHLSPHDSRWLVVYTRSRYEKKVDLLLKQQGINSYCPLVKTKRKWADRYKLVEEPLFSSYLFVHISTKDLSRVQQTQGVVNFVYHDGRPATIAEQDIERIKELTNDHYDIEAVGIKNLTIGDTISVKNGILFDLKGEILEIQGKSVLMLMKQLDCALVAKVKIDYNQLLLTSA